LLVTVTEIELQCTGCKM